MFLKLIRGIAAVEEIPSLLHTTNYCDASPLQPSFSKDTVTFEVFCFAGKMKDTVWKSPLVSWLRSRDELDLIPWREVLLLRFYIASSRWQNKQVILPEWRAGDASRVWQLPLVIRMDPHERPHKIDPEFNLHSWKDRLASFTRKDISCVFIPIRTVPVFCAYLASFRWETLLSDETLSVSTTCRPVNLYLTSMIERGELNHDSRKHPLELRGAIPFPWMLRALSVTHVNVENYVLSALVPWYD